MIGIRIRNTTRRNLGTQLRVARQRGDARVIQRIQALFAIGGGYQLSEVAAILGVSPEAVRLWVRDFIAKGIKSLRFGKSPGRPPKLTKSQKKELATVIENGPEAAGYCGSCWRSPMIQSLIEKRFGAMYSVHYVVQLLANMGFSYQKAAFESCHLDEEARRKWRDETWPEILKLANEKNSHILFGDEASFPQWGSLSYTWAKKGAAPMVKTSGIRKGYKVFGLIDYFSGKFFSKAQTERLNSDSYISFLKGVLLKTRKHIILIQDGARYHTSKQVRAFFNTYEDRITVFQLPSYSPDYNPIEKLWKKIKQHGTHMKYFPTFESLTNKVDEMLRRFENLQHEVLKLFGFYRNLNPTKCHEGIG